MATPNPINASANRYLIDGLVMIGVTDKNTDTAMVKIGITVGTLYGRGTSGMVLRRMNTHVMEVP